MEFPFKKTANTDAINDAFADAFDSLTMPPGYEDWVYRDIRWLNKEYWDKFLAIVGEGNYRLLCSSNTTFSDGTERFYGGQFWISPQGMVNIRTYRDQNRPM